MPRRGRGSPGDYRHRATPAWEQGSGFVRSGFVFSGVYFNVEV